MDKISTTPRLEVLKKFLSEVEKPRPSNDARAVVVDNGVGA